VTQPRSHEGSRRIVVGVDGSPSAGEALRWAVRQAELTGAAVEAIIAWHLPLMVGGYAWPPVGVLESTDFGQLAGRVLAGAINDAVGPDAAVPVTPVVAEGNPAQVLLGAAAGADLLVVGSRGHGGFAEALLGSVSQHCVHHAQCPVVVIRGAGEPGQPG
jgi:nucleotide-binding universal stress UspA family protein